MYASKISINKFRRFENVSVPLGKYLTCIAGQNGVGKSQILALLGNCGQLRRELGDTIIGTSFRADWAEIVQGDFNFDHIDSVKDALSISFDDLPLENNDLFVHGFVSELFFRTTWQTLPVPLSDARKVLKQISNEKVKEITKNKIDLALKTGKDHFTFFNRFRIIPEKTALRDTESKLEWPTYYLGLSRLFPPGESKNASSSKSTRINESINYFKTAYASIFDSEEEIDSISNVRVEESARKRGLGIENPLYGAIGNSTGQDNLNQIIAAIASFKQLKNQLGNSFNGGVLLIDELDASLHPAAQNKLLNFMLREARNIGIQIIFTTHSLSLLKHFTKQMDQQSPEKNEVVLSYLTKGRGHIEIKVNPSFRWINNELLNQSGSRTLPKIPVWTEDETANYVLENALDYFHITNRESLDFMNVSTGWQNILQIVSRDYAYFKKYVVLLDADVSPSKANRLLRDSIFSFINHDQPDTNIKVNSIIQLPNLLPDRDEIIDSKISESDYRPYFELEIWEFLKRLPADDDFYYGEVISDIPLHHNTLIAEGPEGSTYTKGNFESKVKSWYKDNTQIIHEALPFFFQKYNHEVSHFLNQFIAKFNAVAREENRNIMQISRITK